MKKNKSINKEINAKKHKEKNDKERNKNALESLRTPARKGELRLEYYKRII